MKNHAFYATRKGTPKGVKGTWAHECDVCGGKPSEPQHVVSKEEADENVLKALQGGSDESRKRVQSRV